jgi:hypothetical protein
MRIGIRLATIAYRLDSFGGLPEDAALHKVLPLSLLSPMSVTPFLRQPTQSLPLASDALRS